MCAAKNHLLLRVLGILLLAGILPCAIIAGPLDQNLSNPGTQPTTNTNQTNAAPGKPKLVSPYGRVLGSTIAFTWRHVPGATFYYLYVDARGANRIQSWYSVEQAGCSALGSQTCYVTVTADWDLGDGIWWVQGWNSDGYGPWSDGMNFTVNRIQNICGPENGQETFLLFPFVTNSAGFDTGIVISNTGLDPLGTAGAPGDCTVYYYGSPSVVEQTSAIIQPGKGLTFTLMTGGVPGSKSSATGFQGYIIARCRFPYAHGYAFISDRNTPSLGSSSYLAQVLCGKRMPVEQLTQ